jgi:DNA-directed RNA polymerase subunit RPC12/RpoP
MTMRLESGTSPSKCQNCGAHVQADFRRVHGDVDGRAHRCPACDSYRRLMAGSAAGVDVAVPDPTHAPGRHGGRVDPYGGDDDDR